MAISSRITLLGALALWAFQAQAVDVTVAYQTSAEPAKVAQADNTFAKESGAKVDWRKFDSGASVVRALASGDVQIGVIGSSPLTAAVSRGVDLQLFWIIDDINEADVVLLNTCSLVTTTRTTRKSVPCVDSDVSTSSPMTRRTRFSASGSPTR